MDDDDVTRETLRMALEEEGYVVEEATDGAVTLAKLRASQERMVALLDLLMRGVDGFGVLEAVAADAALASRHAYIVLSVAYEAKSLALDTLLTSLHAPFLVKPFDIDQLLGAVAEAAARVA